MAMIAEISQGNAFSASSENGNAAYSATRMWRVILSSPGESYSVNGLTGVNIGDPYSSENPIPCVSLEGRADGDSKLIRIITAQYRATLGGASGGGEVGADPKTQQPDVRPAMYSMSTSLTEITAWGGMIVEGGASQSWSPVVNPAGDLVDPPSRLEPVVTINIDQYSVNDQSVMLGYTGYVNSEPFTFSGLSVGTHCCMLQGISSRPVVEQFGGFTFRGFMVTFAFGVRAHWATTREGFQPIGWDQAVPVTGMTIVQGGLGNGQVEQMALALQHDEATGRVKVPHEYAAGLAAGSKARAMVPLPYPGGGFTQTPAAQPVPLNLDGTPRSRNASPPVLINRICVQPEMSFGNNFSAFGIRLIG